MTSPAPSGYACNIGKFAEDDCVLVEILYELGAVPFVRTNVPQTLMVSNVFSLFCQDCGSGNVGLTLSSYSNVQWSETRNNVFGRTTNPYNRNLAPGGSSGGEGALLAMRGSPLGVGTDLGG